MGAWLKNVWLAIKTVGQGMYITLDRKSTRLNSSHDQISYAVFCLKKKKNKESKNRHVPNIQDVKILQANHGTPRSIVDRASADHALTIIQNVHRSCRQRLDDIDMT